MVKLSKRTGQTVTLAELIEEVGTDAARYFFIMRSMDSQLDSIWIWLRAVPTKIQFIISSMPMLEFAVFSVRLLRMVCL